MTVDDERVRVIAADLQVAACQRQAETARQDAAVADAQTVAEKLDETATEIKINSVVNRRFELDRRNEARTTGASRKASTSTCR